MIRKLRFGLQLLKQVHLRIKDLLPVPVDSRESLRSLLEDSVDDVKLAAEFTLSATQLELHFLNLLSGTGVLRVLVVNISADNLDQRPHQGAQVLYRLVD